MENKAKYGKMIYAVTLLFITLSGFGAMPIFKRYYIADIPGLGWLAKFYITHVIHYTAAVILIALLFYYLFECILNRRMLGKVTKLGWSGVFCLSGLTLSGILLVIKNLNGIFFNHLFISILDLSHLMLCMGLLGTTIYTILTQKRWLLKN